MAALTGAVTGNAVRFTLTSGAIGLAGEVTRSTIPSARTPGGHTITLATGTIGLVGGSASATAPVPPAPKIFFAVADKTTGVVRVAGICMSSDLAEQSVLSTESAYEITQLINPATQAIDPTSVTKAANGLLTGNIIVRATPDLNPAREMQRFKIRASCTTAITAGFTSNGKTYPSQDTDQTNLVQAASVGGNLWCATNGTWALTAHTAGQAQAVLTDFTTMRDAARTKLAGLETTLNAATTAGQISGVVWTTVVPTPPTLGLTK